MPLKTCACRICAGCPTLVASSGVWDIYHGVCAECILAGSPTVPVERLMAKAMNLKGGTWA